MTDAELGAIDARAKAATSGPWRPHKTLDGGNGRDVEAGCKPGIAVARCATPWLVNSRGICAIYAAERDANAVFIAYAREDVPALVAEVHQLRGLLADIKGALTGNSAVRDASGCTCGGADMAARIDRALRGET